jgi:hypothetical protein
MHYNFYASKTDKLDLLAYLFTQTDLRLYDLYSTYGEEVREYHSAEEVAINFDLETGSSSATTFQIWSPQFGARPEFIPLPHQWLGPYSTLFRWPAERLSCGFLSKPLQ